MKQITSQRGDQMNRKEILADIAIVEGDINEARSSPEHEWKLQHEKVLVLKAELAALNELLRLLDQLKEGSDG